MKLSTGLLGSTIPLSTFAHAVTPQSSADMAGPVCVRDLTEITDFVQNNFNGKSQLSYTMWGGAMALNVCRLVNHNAGTEQPCTEVAAIVALVILAVLDIQTETKAPITGEQPVNKRTTELNAVVSIVQDHFSAVGFSWDLIDTPQLAAKFVHTTNDSSSPSNSNDDINDIIQHFIIRGVTHPSVSTTPADISFTTFRNNTGTVCTAHTLANHALTTSNRRRTNPKAGFKINYQTYFWDPRAEKAYGNTDFKQVMLAVAQGMAKDWAYDANYFALGEWIGVAGFRYILFRLLGTAIRIIPEPVAYWGDEYESVEVCGALSSDVRGQLS
ncbi:uncharacterized protein C8A04DRAFT_31276 [Dichotomopilus funicola]|uniref:Uncharacterized protein n=1 Tax=Dichotomopilus funicola TaxID=1934379 RepID=A0AAN6UXZ4_9PEZI|nr:hypothetical protein C8A04DRAFT_31276 [Dichotomopilus funicola]